MALSFRQKVTSNLLQIPGSRLSRKIVVIESDDWGTIRMASPQAFKHFKQLGFPVDACAYNTNDALESNEDLLRLFEVLSSFKDINGNPAIVTANNIVANPDFEKIKAGGYQQYYYEPFTETLKRYPAHDQVYNLYKQGMAEKVFQPQFHGREHLNVPRWMKALQDGDKNAHAAFEQNMFSVHAENAPAYRNEYMDALDCDSAERIDELKQVLSEGLNIFKELWGFRSTSFIAPCYIWHSSLEAALKDNGVRYIQGQSVQFEPQLVNGCQYKNKIHFTGKKNAHEQRYLVRNAHFEPSSNPAFNWVGDAMQRIETAFRWKKPAIISAHRVNFIGFLQKENREKNLTLLSALLTNIQKRWPDVEFMSSDELGKLI